MHIKKPINIPDLFYPQKKKKITKKAKTNLTNKFNKNYQLEATEGREMECPQRTNCWELGRHKLKTDTMTAGRGGGAGDRGGVGQDQTQPERM